MISEIAAMSRRRNDATVGRIKRGLIIDLLRDRRAPLCKCHRRVDKLLQSGIRQYYVTTASINITRSPRTMRWRRGDIRH